MNIIRHPADLDFFRYRHGNASYAIGDNGDWRQGKLQIKEENDFSESELETEQDKSEDKNKEEDLPDE